MDSHSKKDNAVNDISDKEKMLYGVEDVPSLPLCVVFGIQQALLCLGGPLSMAFILSGLLCAEGQYDVTSELLSISIFMCGIGTIMQTMFGLRLGLIQASSNAFLVPMIAMMSLPKWKCPVYLWILMRLRGCAGSSGSMLVANVLSTFSRCAALKVRMFATADDMTVNDTDVWKSRMREVQGNLILASLTQVFLGCTGLTGFLLMLIGPLTIAPTLMLLGFSLSGVVIDLCKSHWGIAFLTICLILLFSLYIGKLNLLLPAWSMKRRCHVVRMPLFQLFAIILSIGISWLFSYILTVSDVFPSNSTDTGYQARTDLGTDVVDRAPWFYWPYPFQFGTPTVSAAGYAGFLVATIASVIESIGDYHAAARVSGVPPPPPHAINRGVAMEGLASIISGMVGAGHGTTSYSQNIGAIGITKVASRAVFLTAGVILLVCGVVGKFGAVLTLIPFPVVGGSLAIPVGMISAVGISTLKFTDLDSTRNLSVLGTSLFLGLMIPQYINDPVNAGAIDTGNEELDNILNVLLGTPMFVGGIIGCLLDNTAPGTDVERGILSWRKEPSYTSNSSLSLYEYPYVTKYFRRMKCCSYIPVSPSFNKEFTTGSCRARCRSKETNEVPSEGGRVNPAAVNGDIESASNSTNL